MINKNSKRLLSLLFLFTLAISQGQQNKNVAQLDAMIVEGMKDWKVPGLATIVVKDGEVVFQKTYGVKNLETRETKSEVAGGA